ncbi:MAG: DegV family protein [Nitriliruptor sp.]|nr:MAG: DegV family protein [Nitriliruptor sp.]
MDRVAVVTDSTCDLPPELVESLGLRVVPLSVIFGDETLIAGVQLSPAGFYERLAASEVLPTTSQPAPAWFEEAYADCADDGYTHVVSIHCSAALSGTVALARDRARQASLDVEVVDSRLVGGALGAAALAAHRVAEAGGSVAEVVAAADRVRATAASLIVVDTLDHLRRGGRLTGAQAAIGTALRVKPILHVTPDGRVEVRERARTWARALERVGALAAEAAGGQPVDVTVTHAIAPERSAQLWEVVDRHVTVRDRLETLIGPVVGSHVGPGAVGVVVVPTG